MYTKSVRAKQYSYIYTYTYIQYIYITSNKFNCSSEEVILDEKNRFLGTAEAGRSLPGLSLSSRCIQRSPAFGQKEQAFRDLARSYPSLSCWSHCPALLAGAAQREEQGEKQKQGGIRRKVVNTCYHGD